MSITTKEAVKKWCPFARVLIAAGGMMPVAVNRYANPHQIEHETRCIGDACMLWRWDGERSKTFQSRFRHAELIEAGIDPAKIIESKEIGLPIDFPGEGLGGKAARIARVWRDPATKEAFVVLDVIEPEIEKIGSCGACVRFPE